MKDVFQLGNHLVWVTPNGTALVIDTSDGKDKLERRGDRQAVRRQEVGLILSGGWHALNNVKGAENYPNHALHVVQGVPPNCAFHRCDVTPTC